MLMLTSLLIKNFQAHQNLLIEFDPLVTTITGSTDRGKSAILRALRWVCLNQPAGEDFTHWGSKFVKAKLKCDEEEIIRKRSSTENIYTLNGGTYKSFGRTNVPERIASLLNLSEVNFQDQLDPPFWFSLSPPEVSRELNQIINLGLIDKTMGNIASQLRHTRATVAVSEERLEEFRQRKKSLYWVVEANEKFTKMVNIQNKLEETAKRWARLDDLLKLGGNTLQTRDNALAGVKTGKETVALGDKLRAVEDKHTNLCLLKASINAAKAKIRPLPPMDRLDKLEQLQAKIKDIDIEEDSLQGLVHQINYWQTCIDGTKEETEAAEKELQQKLKGNCPICGKPLKCPK